MTVIIVEDEDQTLRYTFISEDEGWKVEYKMDEEWYPRGNGVLTPNMMMLEAQQRAYAPIKAKRPKDRREARNELPEKVKR